MKKYLVAGALLGLMSSCGSLLSLNPSLGQSTDNAAVETQEAVTADDANASLLGSLLSSLAGTGSTEANSDGTALTTDGIVSGLLGSILNAFTTVDEATIVGTWYFKGSAFVFESENALASLGSDVVATQVEAKVDQYLAKFNIKEGMSSIIFNEDGTFMFVMGDRYVEGNYELNTNTKELTMTLGMLKTVANVVYDAGTLNLVYQSDGLLRLLKAVGTKNTNNTVSMLTKLLNQYDGMRIGMAFAK